MEERLDWMLLQMKLRLERYAERLIREEKGASDIVAILVIIVILIAIAGIFKSGLAELVDTVFSRVTDFVNQ